MNPAILLVDVASANREELKSFLRNQNCDVVTCQDAESAVICCRRMQPDLVLLYDSLPDTTSFSLCRRLKEDPLNRLAPVVLLKPSADQWDIHRGREAGATDIWATPSALWEVQQRSQTSLRLKMYMDEQAKSALFSLARSVDSKRNLRNGHSDLLMTTPSNWGKVSVLPKKICRNSASPAGFMTSANLPCRKVSFLNPARWMHTKSKSCASIPSSEKKSARPSNRFALSFPSFAITMKRWMAAAILTAFVATPFR